MADWTGTYSSWERNGDHTSNFSVVEKLQKREEERQCQIQKKKDLCDNQEVSVQDSIQLFLSSFSSERKVVEDLLSQSTSVDRNGLVDHFDDISLRMSKLQRYVSESAIFLPGYELKTAQNTLVALQAKIQEKYDELLPKKKFAFKSNRKNIGKKAVPITTKENVKKNEPSVESKSEDDAIIELAACKFVGASNEILEKRSDEISQKDVALAGLNDCVVHLFGAPSAVHINKLKSCKIFCGPVSGSIFIRECVNCTFVLACQQLRIHSTTNSHFYIHVTSKAIVEDCSAVKFAPYNLNYSGLDKDYVLSGLNRDRNNWDKVDDFNWLVADKPSPNWSILKPGDRVASWTV